MPLVLKGMKRPKTLKKFLSHSLSFEVRNDCFFLAIEVFKRNFRLFLFGAGKDINFSEVDGLLRRKNMTKSLTE